MSDCLVIFSSYYSPKAQRLKQRFGRLLKKRPADDVTFLFKSSQQERTETALKAFAGGLFYESGKSKL